LKGQLSGNLLGAIEGQHWVGCVSSRPAEAVVHGDVRGLPARRIG